jgi:hypothetical protein
MDNIAYKVKLQNKAQEIRDQIEDLEFMINEDLPRKIRQLQSKESFLMDQIQYLHKNQTNPNNN